MRRRAFVTGVAATVALLRPTHHIRAQAKLYRIGYLGGRFDAALGASFLDDLREHGWEEGLNIVIEGRWTEGCPERYTNSRPSWSRSNWMSSLPLRRPPFEPCSRQRALHRS